MASQSVPTSSQRVPVRSYSIVKLSSLLRPFRGSLLTQKKTLKFLHLDLISQPFWLAHPAPATLTSPLFLKRVRHVPSQGLGTCCSLILEHSSPTCAHGSLPHFLHVFTTLMIKTRRLCFIFPLAPDVSSPLEHQYWGQGSLSSVSCFL